MDLEALLIGNAAADRAAETAARDALDEANERLAAAEAVCERLVAAACSDDDPALLILAPGPTIDVLLKNWERVRARYL